MEDEIKGLRRDIIAVFLIQAVTLIVVLFK